MADRCERRHLLALTYGLNLGNNLLLAGLVITKQASEWPIVVLALVHGILRAVEVPTNQTLLPNLVPRERLLNAVALNQLMQQGARIFGPLCLLPIIRFVNPETAFFLAAGLYATGWWQILRIRTASYGTMVAQQGILGNLVAGLRYIYTEPLVRSLMLLTLCHCALTMAYESAFPFMARTQLGLGAAKDLFEGPAYLMIGVGAGAVLGNLALARVGDQQRRGQLFLCLGVLSGLTPILLGFTTTLHVAMLAAAAVGASTSAFMPLSQGIIQMLAPDGIRGRVMSANTCHTQGAMGGFNAVSGRIAAAVAPRPTPPISSSAGTRGCRDALRLFREIHPQGEPGSDATVARNAQRLRQAQGEAPRPRRRHPLPLVTAPPHRALTPRRATWLVLRRPELCTPAEQERLTQLTAQDAPLADALALAQDVAQLVRQRQPEHLDPWLARAAESPLVPLQRFAKGLRDDYDAVKARFPRISW